MQIDSGNAGKPKRNLRGPLLVALALPALLVLAYIVEAYNNPLLLNKNYLKAEWGPTILWPWEKGHRAFDPDSGLVSGSINAVGNYAGSLLSDDDIPELVLDVKFRYMREVYEQRNDAIVRGRIVQTEDSFVPAKIRMREGDVPAKIRLKGDFTDHLRGDKWSFRVHVRKGETFLGMRRFSVQNPSVRGYQSENLYFRVLRDYGVLTPRYLYVNLIVNGEDIGIMALEEHFSKELLESQLRREGVIVRYDEDLVFRSRDGIGPNATGFNGIYDDFRNADTDVFQGGKVAESPTLSAHAATATGMLRAFAEGQVTASDIFDVDSMGAYLAVSEIMGAYHATRWHNQRFYMNPITQKMEPIAYDASLKQRESGPASVLVKEPIVQQMLADPKMYARFREVLDDLLQRAESGELIAVLEEAEEPLLSMLRSEYYYLEKYPLHEVTERAAYLATLSDSDLLTADFDTGRPPKVLGRYPAPVRASRIRRGDSYYFEIASATPLDADVTGFETSDGKSFTLETLPLRLTARGLEDIPDYVRFELDPETAEDELFVVGMQNGTSFKVPFVDQNPAVAVSPIPEDNIDTLLRKFPFLTLEGNALRIPRGSWSVRETMALPEGYTLSIGPATTLRFAADAMLIVRDSVFFEGSPEAPVQLLAQLNVPTWKGLAVFHGTERSRWTNVLVQDTRGVELNGWKLMGGTNFYRADVDIADVSIEHHKGEDGLNIISSDFLTTNLSIIDTLSDGFDCDFCTGEVRGGLFKGIGTAGGGDAIDVSTSDLRVTGTRFEDVDDKAVSVGEASRMQATNLQIDACGTGAAAKDGSRLDISDSQITNSRISALMSYIKKPEFGVAELHAANLEMSGNRAIAVVQTGSRVVIDGEPVEAVDIDVDELYDTVMRPGLRRPKPAPVEQNNAGT